MIDLTEPLVPLTEARGLFPGRRPHSGTLFRWALRGIQRGRVKLETVLVGGRRFTSQIAVRDFLEQLNRLTREPRHRDQRRAARVCAAEQRLDAEGI